MAITISEGLRSVATSINVTVAVDKLGKVQRNRLVKFLRTGNIKGNGIPARLALDLLSNHKAPSIHHGRWRVRWENLDEPALDDIYTIGAAIKMSIPSDQDYAPNEMLARIPNGSLYRYYYYRTEYGDLGKHLDTWLGELKFQQSKEVLALADGIMSGSVTTVTLDLLK